MKRILKQNDHFEELQCVPQPPTQTENNGIKDEIFKTQQLLYKENKQ